MAIEEAADQEVGLAGAAMPGAEAKALETGIGLHDSTAEGPTGLAKPAGTVTELRR